MSPDSLPALESDRPAAETERWRRRAVEARDRAADGRFVFAVRTTGVYCRPSCPARRPKPQNVAFFDGPAAARAAGFRPCRRCHPDRAAAESPQSALLRRACALLAADGPEAPSLAAVAAELGLSPAALSRLFRRELGVAPREWRAQRRRDRFKAALKDGQDVAAATYDAGYGSASRVYEDADAALGMTPATYRKGGAGATIAYAVADCVLGRLLVAATARGICAVFLGDSEAALRRALAADFPAATLVPDDAALRGRIAAVLARLEGRKPTGLAAPDLPLDIRATAFQWRVWRALTEIPAGQTRSYGEIAAAIGQPGAARAVGRACATNPLSIIVPCHRAVGGDGALTGYRWDVSRKRKLLTLEKKRSAG